MAKKPESSRIPPAVSAIPLVGGLVKSAEHQAQWMQDMLEQNARLVGQFPATMKTFNDSIERFNQMIGRLDRAVTRIETASKNLTGPLEKMTGALDPKALRQLPETLDALRKESLPALQAASDTQDRIAALQTTLDHVITLVGELPGAALFRRIAIGRDEPSAPAGTEPREATRPTPRTRRPPR